MGSQQGGFPQKPHPLSIPIENSPLFRLKIPQPTPSGGLQFRLVNGKYDPAGEAEAGNAGVQPRQAIAGCKLIKTMGPGAEPAKASPWALKEHHIGLIDLPMP